MNKKSYALLILIFLILAGFLLFSSGASAEYTYRPLEKIPGFETAEKFPEYLLAITKFAIWVVGIVALFMIIWGGFMYVTSAGNTSRLDTAKRVIFDAFFGLIVALGAWLLLYVINPDLVKFESSMEPVNVDEIGVPEEVVAEADQYTHDEAATKLNGAGIGITSTGNCSNQNNSKCTSLQGIPKSTVDKLINLKKESGCSFNVTGGTEVGHKSHGPGRPVVDVTENDCLAKELENPKKYDITKICTTNKYNDVRHNCTYVEKTSHFHLVFKP